MSRGANQERKSRLRGGPRLSRAVGSGLQGWGSFLGQRQQVAAEAEKTAGLRSPVRTETRTPASSGHAGPRAQAPLPWPGLHPVSSREVPQAPIVPASPRSTQYLSVPECPPCPSVPECPPWSTSSLPVASGATWSWESQMPMSRLLQTRTSNGWAFLSSRLPHRHCRPRDISNRTPPPCPTAGPSLGFLWHFLFGTLRGTDSF